MIQDAIKSDIESTMQAGDYDLEEINFRHVKSIFPSYESTVISYAPKVFKKMRQAYGINEEDFKVGSPTKQ